MTDEGKIYNGPKSKLMDDLLESFLERYNLDIWACEDWPVIELYLARACSVLEQKGWSLNDGQGKEGVVIEGAITL